MHGIQLFPARGKLLRAIASKKYFSNLHSAAFVTVFAHNLVHAYKFRIFQKTAGYIYRRLISGFFVPYFSARLDFPSPPLSAPGSPRMQYTKRWGCSCLDVTWRESLLTAIFTVPKLSYLGEHSEVSQARSLHACWTRMLYHNRLETIENSQSTNSAKTLKIFNVYSSLGLWKFRIRVVS